MWQIWIDTGGTFTDGMALAPDGQLHRSKVLSSSRLRGRLIPGETLRIEAPWLTAPLFNGYQLNVLETGETARILDLRPDGTLHLDGPLTASTPVTVELSAGEEAPVLAARLRVERRRRAGTVQPQALERFARRSAGPSRP